MGCGLDWSRGVCCQQVNTALAGGSIETETETETGGGSQGEGVSGGCNWPVVHRVTLTWFLKDIYHKNLSRELIFY